MAQWNGPMEMYVQYGPIELYLKLAGSATIALEKSRKASQTPLQKIRHAVFIEKSMCCYGRFLSRARSLFNLWFKSISDFKLLVQDFSSLHFNHKISFVI